MLVNEWKKAMQVMKKMYKSLSVYVHALKTKRCFNGPSTYLSIHNNVRFYYKKKKKNVVGMRIRIQNVEKRMLLYASLFCMSTVYSFLTNKIPSQCAYHVFYF